jgi:hypothetical protein
MIQNMRVFPLRIFPSQSWQHRKLTLMGKITVIKSLALSKLVHLLTALPNLTQSRLNELTSPKV